MPGKLVRALAFIWTRLMDDRMRTAVMWALNTKFAVGVTGVVANGEGEVLFLEHAFRSPSPWALPAGWMRRGERPEAAIVRKVKEETGLDVAVDRLLAANAFPLPRVDVVYLCRLRGGVPRASAQTPRWRWCRPGETPPGADSYSLALLAQVPAWNAAAS